MRKLIVALLVNVFTVLVRWELSRKWAIDMLYDWVNTYSSPMHSVGYEITEKMQPVISKKTGRRLCPQCGWTEIVGHPHHGCYDLAYETLHQEPEIRQEVTLYEDLDLAMKFFNRLSYVEA